MTYGIGALGVGALGAEPASGSITLVAVNCSQTNAGGTGAIAQVHLLSGMTSSQDNASGTGVIAQAHALIAAPSVQDNIAATSAIVQAHILAAANCSQQNLSASGSLMGSWNPVHMSARVARATVFAAASARAARMTTGVSRA